MKKYVLVLFLVMSSFVESMEYYAEIRGAAFFPTNSRFRNIYGDVHPVGEVEVGASFCNCYQFFLNINEFYDHASLKNCGKTELNTITFSLGPKYTFCLNRCLDFYVGIGLSVAYSYLNNQHASKKYNTSFGGVLKTGTYLHITENIFLDFFVDYNYQPAFHNHIDIGGFRSGIGIGTYF